MNERYLYPHIDALALFDTVRQSLGEGSVSPSWREQSEAALAEASSMLGLLASLSGTPVNIHPISTHQGGVQRWLLRRLLEVPLGLALGDIRGCEHVEKGGGPIAVLAVAWSRRIVCLSRECFQRYLEELRPRGEEMACDRCGTHVPPPGPRMAMAQLGHTILVAGLCQECLGAGTQAG